MTVAQTRVSIDWLTMTQAWQAGRPEQTALKRMRELTPAQIIEPGMRPYPRNYNTAMGGKQMLASWHTDHPKMKVCYNMTGSQCTEYYLAGGKMRELVRRAWQDELNFTRIDFAVDYFGDADIRELVETIADNPECTVARKMSPYRQIEMVGNEKKEYDSGVYIGSQKSPRYICVYNKALEQGMTDQNWTRIELRTRRTMAIQLAEAIVKNGVETAGKQTVRNYAYPAVDWWRDALQGDAIEIPPIGRKETDTRRWLIEVVGPVLAAELQTVDSWNDPLYRTYKQMIDKATNSIPLSKDSG